MKKHTLRSLFFLRLIALTPHAHARARSPLFLAFVTGALLFIQPHTSGATITVTSGGDSGPGTLRQAILNAIPGDTINFAGNLTVIMLTSGMLSIDKDLTINGPGANLLSVQRSAVAGNFSIFYISAGNVTISGLTIAFGRAESFPGDYGGGILNESLGTVTITGCTIASNTAGVGGGIFNVSSMMKLSNSTITGNSAEVAGGVYNSSNILTITNGTISGNSGINGSGIGNSGTIDIADCTISDNFGSGEGGGVFSVGTANVRNTIIARNTAGVDAPDFHGELTSKGFNLIGNTMGTTISGDTTGNQLNVDPMLGPLQDNGGPTQTQAPTINSPAVDRGGSASGVYTDQRGLPRPVDTPLIPTPTGGDASDIGAYELQGNELPFCGHNALVTNANDGGSGSLRSAMASICPGETITFAPNVTGPINLTSTELLIDKTMTIHGPGAKLLTVQRSASAGTDFRIFDVTSTGPVTISGLTIANGTPHNYGGGIINQSANSLTLMDCAITGNAALGGGRPGSNGGGVDNESNGAVNLLNCTVSGNSATRDGGGVFLGAGTVNITNSTISGNVATRLGGGIAGGSLNLTSATIANNSAATGGGVQNFGGAVNARNTIIARNTATSAGPDVSAALTSQGFNFIGNNSDAAIPSPQPSDQIGTAASPKDPLLGSLQDNGGQTKTHALLTGSNAIDKGHSTGSTTDQRGFTRPIDLPGTTNVQGGDGGDIGAFEVSSFSLTAAVSRKNHSGTMYDINLPLSGEAGVECRTGGPSGNHTLVFTFSNNVVSGNASVTSGAGSVQGSPVFAANTMTVNLSGVADLQKITVTLSNVTNNLSQVLPNTSVSVNIVLGDTTGSKSVNSTDIGQTKLRVGQPLDANNFRSDTTVSGSISASDVSQVKASSGHAVP